MASSNATDAEWTYYCLQSSEARNLCVFIGKVTYGFVLPLVAVLGLLGNAMNMPVLLHKWNSATFYRYLTWMSVADFLTALNALILCLYSGWRVPFMRSRTGVWFFIHVAAPLLNMTLVSSTLLVCIVSVERLIGIAWPLRARLIFTKRLSNYLVAATFFASFLFFVPESFSLRVSQMTRSNKSTEWIDAPNPEFNRLLPSYQVYVWINSLILKCFSVLLVACVNVSTIIIFNLSLRRRHELTMDQTSSAGGARRHLNLDGDRKKREFMRLLLAVVTTYLVCVTPMAVVNILEERSYSQLSTQIFTAIANTLEITNACVNFYFYCLWSPEYRRIFKKVMTTSRLSSRLSSQTQRPLDPRRKTVEEKLNFSQKKDGRSFIREVDNEVLL